jgi:hypothetical protein
MSQYACPTMGLAILPADKRLPRACVSWAMLQACNLRRNDRPHGCQPRERGGCRDVGSEVRLSGESFATEWRFQQTKLSFYESTPRPRPKLQTNRLIAHKSLGDTEPESPSHRGGRTIRSHFLRRSPRAEDQPPDWLAYLPSSRHTPCVVRGCRLSRSSRYLGNKSRFDPVHSRKNERRPKAGFVRRHHVQTRF